MKSCPVGDFYKSSLLVNNDENAHHKKAVLRGGHTERTL